MKIFSKPKPQVGWTDYYRDRLASAEWTAWMVFGSIVLSAVFILCGLTCKPAAAEIYDSHAIADAIYIIEGKERAKKPYGILSVPCHSKEDCRKVCLNTIENNFTRWQVAGQPGDFLEFLGNRYAPIEAHPLNKNWIPNLRKVLAEVR